MTLDDILRRFNGVKRLKDNSYQCKCPVHDDKKASLTITEKDGKYLFCCHAGCNTENILSAVGLSFSDFKEKKQYRWKERLEYKQGKKIEAIYDYKSVSGKYLYSKIRFEGKYIRYVTIDDVNDTYQYGKSESTSVLYNLQAIANAIKQKRTIYIVEGEKDVETLRRYGYVATTAGSVEDWKKEFANIFTGANVVILPDNDEPGKKLKDSIIGDLRNCVHSIRWTITSESAKGDVTDYLVKEQHTKQDLEELVSRSQIQYAPWIYFTGKDNETMRVNSGLLAESISKTLHYLIVRRPDEEKDDFYLYENGVYCKANKNKVKSIILRYLPMQLAKDHLINDVYNLLLCQECNIIGYRQLDTDEKYINLRNGLYNIKTKKLEPHTHKLYSTIQLNCEYKPEEKHKPVFQKYIKDLCTDQDGKVDQEKIAVLQEYMGLILSNIKVHRIKLCLVLWSLMGNSGKTQILNLIGEYLGNEKIANIPIQQMNEASKFSVGSIVGKRLVSVGDQTCSTIKDSAVFKQLTGGDPVKVEQKNKQPFSYTFPGGIIIACNNLPGFEDDKGGHLFERLYVVPCLNSIEKERRDGMILDKMLKERNAIFNWFLEGLHRLVENNFKITESVSCEEAMKDYRSKMDTVYRFLSENYIVTGNRSDVVSKADFDKEYMSWCNINGFNSVNKHGIADRMEANGCPKGQGRVEGRAGVMVYKNIKKKSADFNDPLTESERDIICREFEE